MSKKAESKQKITCPLCRLRMKKDEQEFVQLSELMKDERFKKNKKNLVVPFGRTPAGRNIFVDFTDLSHLLIGGKIGSGKTMFIRSLIASLAKKFTPKEIKFVVANYDKTEFSPICRSPYLLFPPINTASEMTKISNLLVDEMNKRYELLERKGIMDIKRYNKKSSSKMPYIFLIIEELAAFIPNKQKAKQKAIDNLVQLAMMGRGVGIHIVISSLRLGAKEFPDVLAGNFTSRLAFRTTTAKDSRDIVFFNGAEKLHGEGDACLSYLVGRKIGDVRLQAPMITKKELADLARRN